MRVPQENYGWNPIESAPFDEDVTLQVTDGQGGPYRLPNPCRLTASGFKQGNAARGHAGEVETVRSGGMEAMTSRRFPAPWRADNPGAVTSSATPTVRRSGGAGGEGA